MKRSAIIFAAVVLVVCAKLATVVYAGLGNTAQIHDYKAFVSNQGCIGLVDIGGADRCYDSSAFWTEYFWNGSAWSGGFNIANHINNTPPATGVTAPTSGTGSITANGTDSSFECTGATSPATITFGTAFASKPVCVCSDETSATAPSVVPNSNGKTLVVTTTGTDSFACVCIAKQ